MASKRDLVEAHAFSRRRLVTAFVSGAPGGREVEPARPGRVIVGGLALTVLLIAGAAVAGVFTQKTPDDWAKEGLYVSKETGARYVITGDSRPVIVRPVINITSAKLILGPKASPTIVTQEAIDAKTIGDDIGILGAPEKPPSTDQLIVSGWTACTDAATGIRVSVAARPQVSPTAAAGSRVVAVGSRYYLLARAARRTSEAPSTFAYRLPASGSERSNMLRALNLPSASSTPVDESFLSLFPVGGALVPRSMGLTGVGRPVDYDTPTSGLPPKARVGDIVRLPGGGAVVLTADGPADLDPFALAVYSTMRVGRDTAVPRDLAMQTTEPPYADASWPDTTLEPVLGEVCGELVTGPSVPPRVDLVADPRADAVAQGVPAGDASVVVAPGRGAYVRGGDWEDVGRGTPYLVDATGKAYPLVGNAPTQLGYGSFRAPTVPDSWLELFPPGKDLSQARALCPPSPKETPCS
jgi:type VII secretion protein EccB